MKKFFLTFLPFFCSASLWALPLANPSEASLLKEGVSFSSENPNGLWSKILHSEIHSLRFGYYGDFVFDRKLQVERNTFSSDIEKTEIHTNAAYLALNFCNTFDVFGIFGATRFFLDTNASSFSALSGQRLFLETDTATSLSIGARLTLFEWGKTAMGISAQYFYVSPNIEKINLADTFTIYPESDVNLKYHEWQVGLGVSHRLWRFIPYFGMTYSQVKIDLSGAFLFPSGEIALYDLESQKGFGIAFGLTLLDCDKMFLTLEARFINEKAVFINREIRF